MPRTSMQTYGQGRAGRILLPRPLQQLQARALSGELPGHRVPWAPVPPQPPQLPQLPVSCSFRSRPTRSIGSGAPAPTAKPPGARPEQRRQTLAPSHGQPCSRIHCNISRFRAPDALNPSLPYSVFHACAWPLRSCNVIVPVHHYYLLLLALLVVLGLGLDVCSERRHPCSRTHLSTSPPAPVHAQRFTHPTGSCAPAPYRNSSRAPSSDPTGVYDIRSAPASRPSPTPPARSSACSRIATTSSAR